MHICPFCSAAYDDRAELTAHLYVAHPDRCEERPRLTVLMEPPDTWERRYDPATPRVVLVAGAEGLVWARVDGQALQVMSPAAVADWVPQHPVQYAVAFGHHRPKPAGPPPSPSAPGAVEQLAALHAPTYSVSASGWLLHPAYRDAPQAFRYELLAGFHTRVNERFCFNCGVPVGYRRAAGEAVRWLPLHLLSAGEQVTVVCRMCAPPF